MTGIMFKEFKIGELHGKSEDHQGYVYFLGHKNMTKIGFTNNPKKRIGNLIALNKIIDPLVWLSDEHETYCINEKQVHRDYRKQRMFGEWFSVDISEIRKEYPYYCSTHLERNIEHEKIMKRIYAEIESEKRKERKAARLTPQEIKS